MPLEIQNFPRPDRASLPYAGCHRVYARGLPRFSRVHLAVLRFDTGGTLHEHPAEIHIDVSSLDGAGLTGIGGDVAHLEAADHVRSPAGKPNRLWRSDQAMITLMFENYAETPQ